MQVSRRSLLASLGTGGVVGTAGCLDFAAGEGPQGPDGRPTTLSCPNEEFRRLDQRFAEENLRFVSARTADDVKFELAVQGTVKTYGSVLRLVLRNLDQTKTTIGSGERIAIQRETGQGWVDVRGTPDGSKVSYPDEPKTVGSGGGHVWSITLREKPIANTLSTADLTVCPQLGAGSYRFVYWGLDGVAIGTEFDIID